MHNACMSVNITIRNVPMAIRDGIAARAASQGKSMQEYLLGELEQLVAKPTLQEWLRRARDRAHEEGAEITAGQIVDAIKIDRQ